MIQISFDSDVPLADRRRLRRFVFWLQRELEIETEVRVEFCFNICGFFEGAGDRIALTRLLVAHEERPIREVAHTTAHEFVHYEQWREAIPYSERGVDQRAEALVKRYEAECGTL